MMMIKGHIKNKVVTFPLISVDVNNITVDKNIYTFVSPNIDDRDFPGIKCDKNI